MTINDRPRRSDAYVPRRLSAFGQGYSLFVRILKYTLPVAAIVLIGLVIFRLSGEAVQPVSTLLNKGEKTAAGQIELLGAKYEGVDEQGRPYTVTADKAMRDPANDEAVLFESPLADISLADKTWLAVKGAAGAFDHATEILKLTGGVTIFHDSGYQLALEDVTIDLRKQTAVTENKVNAQGPLGTISARGMAVKEQGNLVVFAGPATMKLFLTAKKERG